MMFTITLKDLQAVTTFGMYDWEKQSKRMVILSIKLTIENSNAGRSDDMCDTVDYALVESRILLHLENRSYHLIERLVEDVAMLVLSLDARIGKVWIEADKPGALRQARSVSVTAEYGRGLH